DGKESNMTATDTHAERRTKPSMQTLFLFQADDGIRDLIVTGVQTCALPISRIAAAILVRLGVDDIGAAQSRFFEDQGPPLRRSVQVTRPSTPDCRRASLFPVVA